MSVPRRSTVDFQYFKFGDADIHAISTNVPPHVTVVSEEGRTSIGSLFSSLLRIRVSVQRLDAESLLAPRLRFPQYAPI